jgi:hypothetical protein
MRHWKIKIAMLVVMAGTFQVARAQVESQPAPQLVQSTRAPAGAGSVLSVAGRITKGATKKEKVTYLGTVTSAAPAALREQLKLPRGAGLVVDSVEAKSAADAAGIKQHDVLERLNDQLLVNTEQFTALLRTMKSGDEVTLAIIHQGERRTLKAKLGEKEIDGGAGEMNLNILTAPDMAAGVDWVILNAAQPGMAAWEGPKAMALPGRALTLVRTIDGQQTTDWSDDDVAITLVRSADAGKTTHVRVNDKKTGKTLYDGNPNDAADPFKDQPQLIEKLKQAEEAAAKHPTPLFLDFAKVNGGAGGGGGGGFFPPMAGARGKVMQWQDADHMLVMRVMGTNKPVYLLALSKKDGRTLFDGPVASDEERKSVPVEVSEQLDMLIAKPDLAREFGAQEKK